MTDSELSAAIAEAVRGVWEQLEIRRGDWLLHYDPERRWWVMDYCAWVQLHPAHAAAILMHELYQIAWPVAGQLQNERETQAMHAYAKLKELLRAQA